MTYSTMLINSSGRFLNVYEKDSMLTCLADGERVKVEVDASAAAVLNAHDEGKSVKEVYEMFGIGKGLFCDLVYIVLWKAGRLPKSKYAERVAAKHSTP
jgi:hypothetical protein